MPQQDDEQTPHPLLPVIIVGAGPCGVVAAMILKREGIPFVMIEKASREKICSNAGSGFELQMTAVRILSEELGIQNPSKVNGIMHVYAGCYSMSLEGGKFIRDIGLKLGDDGGWHVATVNRSDLQNLLLRELFQTPQEESEFLRCGAPFESYTEDAVKGEVVATLADSTKIRGRLLLGCDGINSKVRRCMHGGEENDPLSFLDVIVYWGKCRVDEGSQMAIELNKTQTYEQDKGTSMVSGLGSSKAPGNLYLCQSEAENQRWLIWALSFPAKHAPALTDDNIRRGGTVLDETGKRMLQEKVKDYGVLLLDAILDSTNASEITQAGLYDRQNLDLPYSSPGKLVALLGDAAHPQSPVLGQGANMAITDAYVVATRLAKQSKIGIPKIVSKYDTEDRRAGANKIIKQARFMTKIMVSSNALLCWLFRIMASFTPIDILISEGVGLDRSNQNFVQHMKQELEME